MIRALGRTIGDIGMPVTVVFGLGLTVYPNLKTNLVNGNGGSRIMADLAIDTGGFLFSELVGWVAGIATGLVTGNPFVAIGTKLSADFAASVAYDNFVAAHGWQESLTNLIEANKPLPPVVPPIPNPTRSFPKATPSFQEPAGESSLNISSENQTSSLDVVPTEILQPTELIPTPTETPKPGS